MAVLLQAVNDRVQAILTASSGQTWDRTRTNIFLDGQPPPFAGDYFAVVHPGEIRNKAGDPAVSLDEEYDVSVTITQRSDRVPVDRAGAAILVKATLGLYALVEALRVGLNVDYNTLHNCGGSYGAGLWTGGKSYSLASTLQGFATPLKFRSASRPAVKGPDWFYAEGQESGPTGVAVQLDFVGARRVQRIESAT